MNLSDRIEIGYPFKVVAYQNVLTENKLLEYTHQFDQLPWKDIWEEESCWFQVTEHDIVKDVTTLFGSAPDEVNFKLDLPTNTLQAPHCDSSQYTKTLQIFLQVEDSPLGGTVIMPDGVQTGFEFPLLSNSMLYFENDKNSWHCVRQRGLVRKSILMRWNIHKN